MVGDCFVRYLRNCFKRSQNHAFIYAAHRPDSIRKCIKFDREVLGQIAYFFGSIQSQLPVAVLR